MKGCVGPTPCGLYGDGEFIRCGRLGHSDPDTWRTKHAIVSGGTGVWFLYPAETFGVDQRFKFSSHGDAVEGMNVAVGRGWPCG